MADVWAQLRGRPSFALGHDLSEIEMRCLAERARQASLRFTAEPIDRGGYLPIAPDGSALIIEEDDLAPRVIRRMLDPGVAVEMIEAD